MSATLSERLKTRIPSLKRFAQRAGEDLRYVPYDLLPVLGLKSRDQLSGLVKAFKPKTPDFNPSIRARMWNEAIRADGLTGVQEPLAPDILSDLTDYFKTTRCHDPYRPHLGAFDWDQPPSDEVNIGFFTWEEVVRAPHLLSLANDRDILAAAELYLGCKPVIDNIGASWSYPQRSVAKGGQRFHRDYDCARGFKVFYYLSDVDEAAGPHCFVRGSHISHDLETAKAQTDDTIMSAFGADRIETVTAPAGSWFIEDVYGFHKGLLPVSKPRLILVVEYNLYPSPLSPKAPVMDNPGGFDPYINQIFLR